VHLDLGGNALDAGAATSLARLRTGLRDDVRLMLALQNTPALRPIAADLTGLVQTTPYRHCVL
jgi:hypothetical protein